MSRSNMPLIIAGNHIGNPQDIPLRTLEVVKKADLLIFEEDRPARLVLKTAKIHRDYLKLNENRADEALEEARNCLINDQEVVYLSDQGMPGNADPGYQLIQLANSLNVAIHIIPGPSSISAAIAASPVRIDQYNYVGFLKRSTEERRAQLASIARSKTTSILMDTPYRFQALMEDCCKVLGSSRTKILAAIEIGNSTQKYFYGSPDEVRSKVADIKKHNFVLIIYP